MFLSFLCLCVPGFCVGGVKLNQKFQGVNSNALASCNLVKTRYCMIFFIQCKSFLPANYCKEHWFSANDLAVSFSPSVDMTHYSRTPIKGPPSGKWEVATFKRATPIKIGIGNLI